MYESSEGPCCPCACACVRAGVKEMRALIAYLHQLDMDGNGMLSFTELAHALLAFEYELPNGQVVVNAFLA